MTVESPDGRNSGDPCEVHKDSTVTPRKEETEGQSKPDSSLITDRGALREQAGLEH